MSSNTKKTKKSTSKEINNAVLKKKIEKLEELLGYNEAVLEEIYETQEAMFPIFADLVKLISRLYKEMKIDDDELKNCIGRLKDAFIEDNELLFNKYLKDNDDFSVAYT